MTPELYIMLGEIKANQAALLSMFTESTDRYEALNSRVTSLEHLKTKVLGGLAVVSLVAGVVWKFIWG